ncbi:hypothetical protein DRO64_08070 [Candidatus Bathyarchaeota archaeon]|nr:MAG: hypothetical protein DRO64_08070 [Candidatus Bathyarchaeota archaeon]
MKNGYDCYIHNLLDIFMDRILVRTDSNLCFIGHPASSRYVIRGSSTDLMEPNDGSSDID